MLKFFLGIIVGLVLANIFGWTRRGVREFREFKRGVAVGRRNPKETL